MSNAKTLQNHNTILSDNNISIDELIEGINNLPNAKTENVLEIEDAFITHTFGGDYTNDRVAIIKYGTFYENNKLTSVSFPNVTSVEGYAFYKCSLLKNIDISKLTTAAAYAFAYTAPSVLNFPLLISASTYSFGYINSTCEVNMPQLTNIGNSCFRDSKGITKGDFAVASKIGPVAFYYCNNLATLILRKSDAICVLENTSAFTGTKIADGTGLIYVPDALVDTYKSATNWSNYANQIKPLSELEG